MGFKVKDTGGSEFKKVPQGTHQAVCNMVVYLGPQETEYMGESRIVEQVFIRWEVPSERIEYEIDGEQKEGPMTISQIYTASLGEKAKLRKHLQGWRNKAFTQDELDGFDIEDVLGTCCQLVVVHNTSKNSKVYANVDSVAGWPNGVTRITAENELIYYGPDNATKYDKLPKWLKEKVGNQPSEQDNLDDSILF